MTGTAVAYSFQSEFTGVTVDKPERCGGCGTDHTMFINRNGCTVCIRCDKQRVLKTNA